MSDVTAPPTIGDDPWGQELNDHLAWLNGQITVVEASNADLQTQITQLEAGNADLQTAVNVLLARSVFSAAYKYTRTAGASAGQIGVQPNWLGLNGTSGFLNVSKTVSSGAEPPWDILLAPGVTGYTIRLRDPITVAFVALRFDGEYVDQGSYIAFPVTMLGGTLPEPGNNNNVVADVIVTP